MEDVLGRALSPEEVVHHIDEDKSNNDPDNLLLLPNNKAHLDLHARLRGGIHTVQESLLERKIRELGFRRGCQSCGVSLHSVRDKYPHLVPTPRRMPTREEALKALSENKTTKAAAKVLGVSREYLVLKYPDDVHKREKDLTEDQVREALRGRTTLQAADLLGVNHNTLRNRYPHLLQKRRSPTNPDDPAVIKLVLEKALDVSYTVRDLAKEHGICARIAASICQAHGVEWQRNLLRKGVSGRPRSSSPKESGPCGPQDGPANQAES
jgi:hypothetical protein